MVANSSTCQLPALLDFCVWADCILQLREVGVIITFWNLAFAVFLVWLLV